MIAALPSTFLKISEPSTLSSLDVLVRGLKQEMSMRLAVRYARCLPQVLVHRALDDAEELARTTGFPHLFLPAIAEEKLQRVSRAVCSEFDGKQSQGLGAAA